MLKLKRLGIDTYKEHVVYLRRDSHVCLAEGFEVHTRVLITYKGKEISATLQLVDSDILSTDQVSVCEYSWRYLDAEEGQTIQISHAHPAASLGYVRSKMYGNNLSYGQLKAIIDDITLGHYTDIMISAFLTSCVGGRLNSKEVIDLTQAMINTGDHLHWSQAMIVDKHCVGGIPGNRTTPIVVPIVTSLGFIMPKTSSRSITSPAGTADTMEVFTNVDLSLEDMRRVVNQEGGCIIWGGSASLSPADDILIRVERVLDIDSEGQLIASVLSKKIAAGSTHVVIDIPIGATAKVRGQHMADNLKSLFATVGQALGIGVKIMISDGSQPVGRGMGPALEARDVLAVLENNVNAPQDLRDRALMIAGHIIEFSSQYAPGQGYKVAEQVLTSGQALRKFKAICLAQGGMRDIPVAPFSYPITSRTHGKVSIIDNRRIAMVAKLAGAPNDKAAGVDLHVRLHQPVLKGDVLFTIHSQTHGQLQYVLDFMSKNETIVQVAQV
ncbi:MAG: thymidine phosphorylase family protein [Alphaproteobacteria bacterium]|nr:thymidine phosphorylase family protein [Alphaproteobacteria bacterium]